MGKRPPRPTNDATSGRLFVVQKHAATRLHYDFRLEWNGVLVSWAVPKGPSYDPKEKRYAVHVEDHPVEYADFEGVIPDDNYGAGEVIVWDRGQWKPLEDFDEGLKKGKLLFELDGWKLKGTWTLVRMQKSEKDWLLIKHQDAFAGRPEPPDGSILSGLTLEELAARKVKLEALRAEVAASGAPRRRVEASEVEPMLAETAPAPFSRPGWLFEVKYDGFRLIAAREQGRPKLLYRRGLDATSIYPDVARALAALPVESLVLDGEIVVHDQQGRPSFQRLQKRSQLQRAADIARAAVELPAVLWCFDLLGFDEWDLRPLPLVERKRLLRQLLPAVGPLRYAEHFEERGEELFRAAHELGIEGVMGKRASSPYRAGRSGDWLKVRVLCTGDFAVIGYTQPKGGRIGFGALHLGAYAGGRLRYVGRVGSGFSDRQLAEVRRQLDEHRLPKPPFDASAGPRPEGSGHRWSTPTLVCEVRFSDFTEEHLLRQPVFLRFRDDKTAEECELPATRDAPDSDGHEPPPPAPPEAIEPAGRSVPFTNLDKIFWPDEGYTKGDLIAYYRAVAPWLLHYLRDRPVVLTRFPDGIAGKSFFQKDAPGFAPEWLRTERMWSEQAEREIDYFVCDDLDSLLYLANLGSIPLHVWASRVTTLERPDWVVLDLDPKGAPFADVIALAQAARRLCEEIELPSYCKTTGSTGLHVLIPLGRVCTFDQAKTIGELLSRVLCHRAPEIATLQRVIERRAGKVYLDYLQNGHGKLIVAPLSVRPLPGAPVSMPLGWHEVVPGLSPTQFTIRDAPERLARLGDPMTAVVDEVPDLPAILERLSSRLG